MRDEIQLMVITGQPLANLIPVLERKPRTVALMVSDKMFDACNSFTELLKGLMPEVIIRTFPGLPDTHVELIQEWALSMLDQLPADSLKTVNLTGGTKLMALALYPILCDDRSTVIYLNMEHSCIETLYPKISSQLIPGLLTIKVYLKAMGKTFRQSLSDDAQWCQQSDARWEITKDLVRISADHVNVLRALNQTMAHVSDKINSNEQPYTFKSGFRPLAEFLRKCAKANLLDLDEAEERFYVKSESVHRYLTGGWLEEYCWQTAKRLKFEDLACGVQYTDDIDRKKDIRNELDLIIVHNNRMLAVECKSGQIDIEGSASEIIYKLDSMATHVGGLNCDRLLVSAQPLDHQTSGNRTVHASARAQASAVDTCAGSDLNKLKDRLLSWRDSKA